MFIETEEDVGKQENVEITEEKKQTGKKRRREKKKPNSNSNSGSATDSTPTERKEDNMDGMKVNKQHSLKSSNKDTSIGIRRFLIAGRKSRKS